jgi:hypothetical protein
MDLPTNKNIVRIDIATLVGLLQASRNQFITLVWQSEQTSRFYTTQRRCKCGHVFFGRAATCPECGEKGKQEPTAINGKSITRVYVCNMRNDFNFANAVRNMLARRGETEAADQWTGPKERTWGEHVDHTPFVVHTPQSDDVMRLYGHFLPGTWRNGQRAYFTVDGFTGFYVNGRKADDAEIEALRKPRKQAETATDAARLAQHPVNARLDDGAFAKINGQWYLILPPTAEQIEEVAAAALAFSEKVEAEALAPAA